MKSALWEADDKKRERDSLATPQVEIEHVKNVYDSIASHWHGTRYKPWPKVETFITSQPPGTLFADIGCGNGKNIPCCFENGGFGVGCDISVELLKIAANRNLESVVGDIVKVPYRTSCFDSVVCIAVLHHISTESRRIESLKECMRVVKVGGCGLFYAWAMEQTVDAVPTEKRQDDKKAISGHRFEQSDVLVPWHIKSTVDKSAFVASHVTVDEEKKYFIFQRYCHVYKAGELEDLFKHLEPWVSVKSVYWDSGNWAVVAEKVNEFGKKKHTLSF